VWGAPTSLQRRPALDCTWHSAIYRTPHVPRTRRPRSRRSQRRPARPSRVARSRRGWVPAILDQIRRVATVVRCRLNQTGTPAYASLWVWLALSCAVAAGFVIPHHGLPRLLFLVVLLWLVSTVVVGLMAFAGPSTFLIGSQAQHVVGVLDEPIPAHPPWWLERYRRVHAWVPIAAVVVVPFRLLRLYRPTSGSGLSSWNTYLFTAALSLSGISVVIAPSSSSHASSTDLRTLEAWGSSRDEPKYFST
jgi:hypothetical protein